jgi:acyl carrier protein
VKQSKEDFTAEMSAWLTERLARPGVTVQPHTSLFGGGLIDSMRILELIAYTERSIGRMIPDSLIRMDNFSSVARIAEVFLGEPTNAAA